MISASAALERLVEGNWRFRARGWNGADGTSEERRAGLVGGQAPFAIVLGCSDSRVPAEMVFDQGLGDLFVIRVAGNIVAPSQVGSVEFAAGQYGSRLVVVLGHTDCGAVRATLDSVREIGVAPRHNLNSIVQRVRGPVLSVLEAGPDASDDEVVGRAVRANIRASADHLRHGSPLLERLIREDGLLVVGAEYDLASGRVEFFDVPDGVWAAP